MCNHDTSREENSVFPLCFSHPLSPLVLGDLFSEYLFSDPQSGTGGAASAGIRLLAEGAPIICSGTKKEE